MPSKLMAMSQSSGSPLGSLRQPVTSCAERLSGSLSSSIVCGTRTQRGRVLVNGIGACAARGRLQPSHVLASSAYGDRHPECRGDCVASRAIRTTRDRLCRKAGQGAYRALLLDAGRPQTGDPVALEIEYAIHAEIYASIDCQDCGGPWCDVLRVTRYRCRECGLPPVLTDIATDSMAVQLTNQVSSDT